MATPALNHLHLTTLCVVVERGSYTRAAEELGITQPSLPQQIRELERACGAPLFLQQGRMLVPTPLAQQLAQIGLEP